MANDGEYETNEETAGLRTRAKGPLAHKAAHAPATVGELVAGLNRAFPRPMPRDGIARDFWWATRPSRSRAWHARSIRRFRPYAKRRGWALTRS